MNATQKNEPDPELTAIRLGWLTVEVFNRIKHHAIWFDSQFPEE